MNAVQFNRNVVPLADLNHVRMQFGKVITFVKRIPGMLPVRIPLEGLIIENGALFEVIGLEMGTYRTQIISQRTRIVVHVEPQKTLPKYQP